MINIDKIEDICLKHEITVEMFYITLLIMFQNKEDLSKYAKVTKPYRKKFISEAEIDRLTAIDFIVKKPDGKYRAGKSFVDLFIDRVKASNEFFNTYPSYSLNRDTSKSYPLKAVDLKSFADLYKSIITTTADHKELMEDLKYAIENNYGFTRIDTFLINGLYKDIRKNRTGDEITNNSTHVEKNYEV